MANIKSNPPPRDLLLIFQQCMQIFAQDFTKLLSRKIYTVCICVCQIITFESVDVESSYLDIRCISSKYGSGSYVKIIGSRSRSQKPKRSKCIFPQCKTSISHNSTSIKHTATRFSTMADRMVTKCN